MTYRLPAPDDDGVYPDPFPPCKHEYERQTLKDPERPGLTPYLRVFLICRHCGHSQHFPEGYRHPWL
jgi:hypothetical protein